MSPTLILAPEVKVTVVSPTAVEASFTVVTAACVYAVALGQVDTNRLLPKAPAVRAAKVPTEA